MKKFKFKIWLTLIIIGLIGVASLLLSELPMDSVPNDILEKISPGTMKLLILLNPAFLLLITTTIGVMLYDKVKFSVPLIESMIRKDYIREISIADILRFGILFGVIAGVLISLTAYLCDPYPPLELKEASKKMELNVVTKLLYGGRQKSCSHASVL